MILVKLQSQEETNVYMERDKITLHTLESVQNYPEIVSRPSHRTDKVQLDTHNIYNHVSTSPNHPNNWQTKSTCDVRVVRVVIADVPAGSPHPYIFVINIISYTFSKLVTSSCRLNV